MVLRFRMRVLHVVPTFYPAVCYGGPIYSVLQLCLNLSGLGSDVKVLTTDANGAARLLPEQQRDPVLDPLRVDFCRRVGSGMVAPALLDRVVNGAKWADVIHLTAVYNFSTIPTLLAARFARKPLVWSPRGALQRWAGSRHTTGKAFWNSTCRVLSPRGMTLHVTSQQEAAESAPSVGNPASCIIPNGIDIPPLPPDPPSDGVLKLLFIGRLDPKKGIENLIATLRPSSRLGLGKWRLQIAGDGPADYVARLRKLVCDSGIQEHVEFSGDVRGREKDQAFAGSDLVVVPSHTENFGNVVAEALAHARPVIVSRATPWSEVEQYGCGLWVDNDPRSLAAALQTLQGSDRSAMGLRGRQWMIAAFSWHEQARRMLSLYESLVHG
jgi:glycosyltransferase involved in cell wall biosynthesis